MAAITETLTVTAKTPRRRAGFAFGPAPVALDRAALSDDDFAAIIADPLLDVSVANAAETAAGETPPSAAASDQKAAEAPSPVLDAEPAARRAKGRPKK